MTNIHHTIQVSPVVHKAPEGDSMPTIELTILEPSEESKMYAYATPAHASFAAIHVLTLLKSGITMEDHGEFEKYPERVYLDLSGVLQGMSDDEQVELLGEDSDEDVTIILDRLYTTYAGGLYPAVPFDAPRFIHELVWLLLNEACRLAGDRGGVIHV